MPFTGLIDWYIRKQQHRLLFYLNAHYMYAHTESGKIPLMYLTCITQMLQVTKDDDVGDYWYVTADVQLLLLLQSICWDSLLDVSVWMIDLPYHILPSVQTSWI